MPAETRMTPRERVRLALAHKEPDQVPIDDKVWSATLARWRREGMPDDVSAEDYFDFALRQHLPDHTPRFPERVIERTEEYVVEVTPYGGVRRHHRDRSTTPELIDYPVKTQEDWKAIKARLQPHFTRVDWVSYRRLYERARAEDRWVTYRAYIGYDALQHYIRSDELLPLLLTDPSWVRDMAETHADLVIELAKIIIEQGLKPDGAFLLGDMGYRNAPLFSPRTYRQVFKPAERRVYEFFHSQGMPVFLHCCGQIKPLIPDLLDIGLDCLQGLEVKAGMDLVELKREFGKDLTLMGGIDVRAMSDPDPDVIEREIARKIPVAMAGGGYIYHSDHSVPNDVSFQQYCRVIELVKKYGRY
jgi:uroporphyrinogen decarboxylase